MKIFFYSDGKAEFPAAITQKPF